MSVDDSRRAFRVDVLDAADLRNAPVDRDDRIRVENRIADVAAQHQPDILDDKLGRTARRRGFLMRHRRSPWLDGPFLGRPRQMLKVIDASSNSFVYK